MHIQFQKFKCIGLDSCFWVAREAEPSNGSGCQRHAIPPRSTLLQKLSGFPKIVASAGNQMLNTWAFLIHPQDIWSCAIAKHELLSKMERSSPNTGIMWSSISCLLLRVSLALHFLRLRRMAESSHEAYTIGTCLGYYSTAVKKL